MNAAASAPYIISTFFSIYRVHFSSAIYSRIIVFNLSRRLFSTLCFTDVAHGNFTFDVFPTNEITQNDVNEKERGSFHQHPEIPGKHKSTKLSTYLNGISVNHA